MTFPGGLLSRPSDDLGCMACRRGFRYQFLKVCASAFRAGHDGRTAHDELVEDVAAFAAFVVVDGHVGFPTKVADVSILARRMPGPSAVPGEEGEGDHADGEQGDKIRFGNCSCSDVWRVKRIIYDGGRNVRSNRPCVYLIVVAPERVAISDDRYAVPWRRCYEGKHAPEAGADTQGIPGTGRDISTPKCGISAMTGP